MIDFTFLQIIMFLCIYLFWVNFLIFSIIYIFCFFLACCLLYCLYLNLVFFGLILTLIEFHVCSILFFIAFAWLQYEAETAYVLKYSFTYGQYIFYTCCFFCITYINTLFFFLKSIYIKLFYESFIILYIKLSYTTSSILYIIYNLLFTFLSLEFLLLNLILFFIIIVLHIVLQFCTTQIRLSNIKKYIYFNVQNIENILLRQQNIYLQHVRDTSTRIYLKEVESFIRDSTKQYIIYYPKKQKNILDQDGGFYTKIISTTSQWTTSIHTTK